MRVFKTDTRYFALGEWQCWEVLIMDKRLSLWGGLHIWGDFKWSTWVLPGSSHLGLLHGLADGHRAETNIQWQRKEILCWPCRGCWAEQCQLHLKDKANWVLCVLWSTGEIPASNPDCQAWEAVLNRLVWILFCIYKQGGHWKDSAWIHVSILHVPVWKYLKNSWASFKVIWFL